MLHPTSRQITFDFYRWYGLFN